MALAGIALALGEKRGRMRATRDLELLEGVAEVVLDRLIAQSEQRGDLLVRLALDDQCEDAPLLSRQRLGLLETRSDRARQHGVEHRPARRRVADRAHQRLVADVLQQVTARAGEQGGLDRLVVGMRGEEEDADRWRSRKDLAAGVHAAAV